MPNYAQVTLIGHLGRDPESREVGDHTVVNFSLATTRKRKGKEDVTTWWNINAWNRTGETVLRYLKKGSPCLVVGDACLRPFTKKDGTAGTTLDVDADRVVFLGGREDKSDDLGEAKSVGEGVAKLKAKVAEMGGGKPDDGIPFMRCDPWGTV